MSLRLALLLNYIESQASLEDLVKIRKATRDAEEVQKNRGQELLKAEWSLLYRQWLKKENASLPKENSISLTLEYVAPRILSYKITIPESNLSFTLEADHLYMELRFSPSWIPEGENDSCHLFIDRNGQHKGCCRDNCHIFDLITSHPERIAFLTGFVFSVQNKLIEKRKLLCGQRIALEDLPPQ